MKTTLHLPRILLLAALCSYNLLRPQEAPQQEAAQLERAAVQEQVEVGTPASPELSPFSLGQGALQGAIANSVQEVTGKVNISLPIATLKARTLSYPVTLSYNGDAVFKQAQYLNQFRSQSTLGVGWALQHPKIVADHKGTATRDDDTFYLVDGGSSTRLICTKKQQVAQPGYGQNYLDFELEQYKPYKIRYLISNTSASTTYPYDYWTIKDDKGITYTYGRTDNARENVLAWGNWIGDSKNPNGATPHTTVWNLSEIDNQDWEDYSLKFTYEKVNHRISSGSSITHTSASYIKEIRSSSRRKIVFTYAEKSPEEYYEPHKEQPEPDAYQERFETKYLEAISVYDDAGEQVYTYTMGYEVRKKAHSNDQNRYLQSITQTDKQGNSLPPVELAYHTNGPYEGGVKQVTYPSGGSVTYTYSEQNVFDTTDPPIAVEGTLTSGYSTIGGFAGNDYALRLMRKGNPLNGRHGFQMKVEYDWWVGQGWKRSEFIFPELVTEYNQDNTHRVENLKFASGKDFFAFLVFGKTIDRGSIYLFHKAPDGLSWTRTEYQNLSLQSNNNYSNDSPHKDPVLMAGEHFVAVGENQSNHGRLYRFVWNGNTWGSHTLHQGTGTYYYGATNNFIIALEEDGGNDLVTGNYHSDLYYIHYLDTEKQWQTKSWSEKIDHTYNYVHGTNDPSYLYPSNSMAGFMADNNPEYILRWDTNYNLVAVDNILGEHSDTYLLLPVMNNVFALVDGSIHRVIKAVGFDGSNWSVESFDINSTSYALGDNAILTSKYRVSLDLQSYLYRYYPNTHQWSDKPIGPVTVNKAKGFGQGFFVVGNHGYKTENTGVTTSLGRISDYERSECLIHNNLSGVYHEPTSTDANKGKKYFYLNKKNGALFDIVFPYNNLLDSYGDNIPQLGVKTNRFMSPNIFYLNGVDSNGNHFKRIVELALDQEVKNIIVSSIVIDNGGGEVRHIAYTYADAHTLPDDESTFYGKVTIQNKGDGSGNIGKTIKYFETGKEDIRLAGLPTKVIVEDKNGNPVSETETTWKQFTKNFTNTAYTNIGIGHYLRPETTTEKLLFSGQEVVTETQNTYNTLGLLTQTSRKNSSGETETTSIQYAYENNDVVQSKNMLAFPYQTKTQINGEEVAVERSIWKEFGPVYAYQNKSGATQNTLRLTNEITKVDSRGNVIESHNGKGLYKTVLYGYNSLYPVATIVNATYAEVVGALTTSYYDQLYELDNQLGELDNTQLEAELSRLYTQLPQAMVTINLYDTQGRVIRSLDERGEAVNFIYDTFGRLEYTTDANGKVLEKREYNYGRQE